LRILIQAVHGKQGERYGWVPHQLRFLGAQGDISISRDIGRFVIGIESTDPATYTVATAAVVAVALSAAFIPARRASRVDPLTALRQE